MNNSKNNKQIINRFLNLFDVIPCDEAETGILEGVSHDELCRAIEYWINNIKLVVNDVLWILQNQGLSDDGIDILIDFIDTKNRIGFQIKSDNDTKKRDLSKSVLSQISRSKKHNLSRYIIVLGGKLNNNKQFQRIRNLISELHQIEEDYIIVIPPEKIVNIIKASRENVNPGKYLNLETSSAMKITDAIAQKLTDENQETTITFSKKNKKTKSGESKQKFKMSMSLEKEKAYELANSIEHPLLTEEKLTISKESFSNFKLVFENGNREFTNIDQISLKRVVNKVSLRFLFFNHDGDVIQSREMSFIPRKVNKGVHLLHEEEEDPLAFEIFTLEENGNLFTKLNAVVDFRGREIQTIVKTLEFLQSIPKTTRFEVRETKTDQVFLEGGEPEDLNINIDSTTIEILDKLAFIQQKTSQQIIIPKDFSGFTQDDINTIYKVAKSLEHGYFETKKISFQLTMKKEIILSMIDLLLENKGSRLQMDQKGGLCVRILNQEINLGEAIDITKGLLPKENLSELHERIKKSDDIKFEIKFETIGEKYRYKLIEYSKGNSDV